MFDTSKIAGVAEWLAKLPRPLRRKAFSLLVGKIVPFVGTSRMEILEMSPARVAARVRNRRPVRNHIGGVHAAAATLLAETVTGFVVAMNLPAGKLPLIKTMHVEFEKRMKGNLSAEAWLEEADRRKLATDQRGAIQVPVTITDGTGQQPVRAEMTWAWVPDKRATDRAQGRGGG